MSSQRILDPRPGIYFKKKQLAGVLVFHDFDFRAEKMRTKYISHQKEIIKQEVNRVVDMIAYGKEKINLNIEDFMYKKKECQDFF